MIRTWKINLPMKTHRTLKISINMRTEIRMTRMQIFSAWVQNLSHRKQGWAYHIKKKEKRPVSPMCDKQRDS